MLHKAGFVVNLLRHHCCCPHNAGLSIIGNLCYMGGRSPQCCRADSPVQPETRCAHVITLMLHASGVCMHSSRFMGCWHSAV